MIDKMTQLVEDSLEEAKELAIAHRNYQLDIPHLWAVLVKPDQFAFQFYQSLEINTNPVSYTHSPSPRDRG